LEQLLFDLEPAFPFGTRFPPNGTEIDDALTHDVAPPAEALRESDRRFRALLQALPAAVYTTDAAGRVTFYNEAAAELWGREPELGSSEWCGSWRLLWPDGQPMRHDECPMAIALRENRALTGEAIAVRPDGTQVPFAAYPKPLHDETGRMLGAVNTLVDISHRKMHEERQRLLINELNHRVKNTLATVQSIAVQSLRGCPRDQVQWFQNRLVALSKAHDLLTAQNWRGASMRELVNTVVAPLVGQDHQRCDVSGPDLFVPPRVTLSLSMALHELCTNAAKYGALSGVSGRVLISWRSEKDRFLLRWQELDGPPVRAPRRRGFGSRLITRGVAHDLRAQVRLEYRATGVVCEIDASLAETTDSIGSGT
jgi:PAS domain S-box-containing protein